MWLVIGFFFYCGSVLVLLIVVFVNCLCINCFCKIVFFYFELKDKYLGVFGVLLSNIVFIRFMYMSIVKLGNMLCGWCMWNLFEIFF